MSDRLVLVVWERYPGGGARLEMLLAIAEAANEQGNCHINVAQLGAAARLSRRSAQRAVNQLRDDRWIVTGRMLGRGGKLVYQINAPKLKRSCRGGHDAAAMLMQRERPLGATEAGLAERVSLRGGECQSGTAGEVCQSVTQLSECQPDAPPQLNASALDAPSNATEEATLSRQEQEVFWAGEAAWPAANAETTPEGEFQGAEVGTEPSGSLYGPATEPFEDDFEPVAADDAFLAALRLQAERQAERSNRAGFVPRRTR